MILEEGVYEGSAKKKKTQGFKKFDLAVACRLSAMGL